MQDSIYASLASNLGMLHARGAAAPEDAAPPPPGRDPERTPDGGLIVRSDMQKYDTVRQRLNSLMRTEQFGADGALVRTHMMDLELAYLYQADVMRLLDHAGFDLVRISGDFTGRPFGRDSDELVVEARRD